jgi:signal transduction histidine kinase
MDTKSSVKKVFISVQKLKEECIIKIKDTGPGFSESKIKNPFAAFETTKEIGKGTGLGLWVVKNILDKTDGKIEINNYENGAEITISIPIEKKEA